MAQRKVRLIRRSSLIAALCIISAAVILAVHGDGLFELGNGFDSAGSADIAGDMAQEGCDWADLFDSDPTEAEIAEAVASCGGVSAVFVADQLSQGSFKDDTTFSKGSSKNDQAIASWNWTTGNSPAKSDLSNVYAYATLNDLNDLIIYVGIERLDPSGDSHIDVEFNQSLIGLDRDPPCDGDFSEGPADGPPCEFTGEKSINDILTVMNFERGGTLGFVEIRLWDGQTYVLVETVGGEGCNSTDTVCAFNNGKPIDGGPWPSFDSRGNVTGTLEENAFTEVGINVTALIGSTPCIVTAQAKSRSSQSFSSDLKDFALASFEICSIEVTKDGRGPTGEPLSKIGDDITFSYSIENTGAASLSMESVDDDLVGDLTAAAEAAGCNPLEPQESCSFDITYSIADDADDPMVSSVFATYSSFSAFKAGTESLVSAVSDSDELAVNLFQPSVSVVKSGDTLSTAGNTVHYVIEITNTSSEDTPALANGSIIDVPLLGDLLAAGNPFVTSSTCFDTLPTGSSCTIEASRVVLESDPDPLVNNVYVSYNPAGGFPNIIADSDDHTVDLAHPSGILALVAAPTEAYRGEIVTYAYTIENMGDVALNLVSAADSLLGDISGSFPDSLAPGDPAVTFTLQRIIQSDDPDPLVSDVMVIYQVAGLPNQLTFTAGTVVDILIPCALSPGFWKGGEGVRKWDDISADYIAQLAGFDGGTTFPYLDPRLAGSSYLDVLNLSAQGDVTRQLAFKYVAARLNQAAFGVRSETAALLDMVASYFAAHPVGSDPGGDAGAQGQALLNEVNAYFVTVGEGLCPSPDEF